MLIHPMPHPIAFSIGPVPIHWYGLMYLAAFIQFVILGRYRIRLPHLKAVGWQKEDIDDMLFYAVLGVVIGGRMGEVFFYHPEFYFSNPIQILETWKGGMSYHGGLIGVLLATAIWAKKRGRNVLDIYDFIAPLVPLGYAFGRIGNFINGELPGRVCDPNLPWAMIWPNVDSQPRYPSPIFQALIDGLLVFILTWWFSRKERPRLAVGALYVFLYGCARFFTEYFRVPDFTCTFSGITFSAGQIYSVPMIIAGLIMLKWAYRKRI